MSIGRRASLCVVASLTLFLAAAAAQELTEQEAVKRFLGQSPQSRELRAAVAAVQAETRGWSLWPNPRSNVTREGAGVTNFVQLEQSLPISGRLGFMRQAGAAAVNSSDAKSLFAVWELCSDMRLEFYALVLAQERERAIRKSFEDLDEVLRILQEREKEGEGSTFDRLRTERERFELQTELVAAQVRTLEARSRLASFFTSDIEPAALRVQGQLQSSAILPPLSEVLARALNTRPDLMSEQQHSEQLRFEQRAAERLRIPEPSFYTGLKRAESRGSMELGPVFGVSVPIPIFNRGKTEVARLKAELDRSQARRDALQQKLQAEVEAAYGTVELRRGIEEEYRQQLASTGSRLKSVAQLAYQEGEQGILELLDAYRVTRQSELREVELSGAAKAAEIELERAAGEPILNREVFP